MTHRTMRRLRLARIERSLPVLQRKPNAINRKRKGQREETKKKADTRQENGIQKRPRQQEQNEQTKACKVCAL